MFSCIKTITGVQTAMSIPLLTAPPRRSFLSIFKNDYVNAVLIALTLTSVTYLLAYEVGWVSGEPNWLEVGAAGLNYGATYLSIKQKRLFYLIGVLASALYAVVYGQYGLLASSVLSMYLTISLFYGYWRWGKDSNTRPVHHIKGWWWVAYIMATAVFWLGAFLTVRALGGSFAPWDSAILILTIAAQFMLDNKVIETWAVWTLVNIVGTIVYFNSELYFAAVQQVLFGVANLWGYLAWRKTMVSQKPYTPYNPMKNRA